MDLPQPTDAHRLLARLAGTWEGEETIAPSPMDPEGGTATGRVENVACLDGFAVVQDYVQSRGGAEHFKGHGVFSVEPGSGRLRLDWCDTMGGAASTFWGSADGDVLSFTCETPQMNTRATFTLGDDSYDFAMEVSPDGGQWFPFMQGTYARAG